MATILCSFLDLLWFVGMESTSSTLQWPSGIKALALHRSLSGHMTPPSTPFEMDQVLLKYTKTSKSRSPSSQTLEQRVNILRSY